MDKKIGNVSPGKTYVLRFKPSNSNEWSKTYEFTVPIPTEQQIQAGTSTSQSGAGKLNTILKTNTNKTWTDLSDIYWDVAVSNDYGLWDSATDATAIRCPYVGWYTATLYTPFLLTTSLGSYNSKTIDAQFYKFREGRDLLPGGVPESQILSRQTVNTNGLYTVIDQMAVTNTTTFYLDNTEEYIIATVDAHGGSGGAGNDSKGTLLSGATLSVTYLGV